MLKKDGTYNMILSQLRELRHPFVASVLQDLLQVLASNGPQLSPFVDPNLPLPLNNLVHLRDARRNDPLDTMLPHFLSQQFPTNSASGHGEA